MASAIYYIHANQGPRLTDIGDVAEAPGVEQFDTTTRRAQPVAKAC